MKTEVNAIIKGRQYDPENPAVEQYYKAGQYIAALQVAMASLKGQENPACEVLRKHLKEMKTNTEAQRVTTLRIVARVDADNIATAQVAI